MMPWCHTCQGPPSYSYKNGFKRDTIICDKGIGKVKMTLYKHFDPGVYMCGFEQDDAGYIVLERGWILHQFCSLTCLNKHSPLSELEKGMNDFDKYDILAELERVKKAKENVKEKAKEKLKKEKVIENVLRYKDTVEILKQENKLLYKKLDGFQENQKEIIQHIQLDEDKVKENIEKKKQKEIDKLTDALKERDKHNFQLQCRIIELEGKNKGIL